MPLVRPEDIRHHYDHLSVFYRALWGDHIHHGYWENTESPTVAQLKLIERLAARARIPHGARVLDIGCGLGGSALWLAGKLRCSVLGVTISPVQAAMAAEQARSEKLEDRVRFEVMDANHLDLPPQSFDAVWIIESSEHLHDKRRFIESCARVLRPGGALALCAWLFADRFKRPDHERLVAEVCRGMLCPSLASMPDYIAWMRAAGFEAIEAEDITSNIQKTWTLCSALIRKPAVTRLLSRLGDPSTRRFIRAFAAIRRAYAKGAMSYGMFTARCPQPLYSTTSRRVARAAL